MAVVTAKAIIPHKITRIAAFTGLAFPNFAPIKPSNAKKKIEETIRWGGDQLLLQGGHHPELGLSFYTNLFRQLKELYPTIKLHTLGPPEVAHITKLEKSTHREVLTELKKAGMDSLPGAGAEILIDRVRRLISKGKLSTRLVI